MTLFKNIKIGAKLLTGFVVVALFSSVVGYFGVKAISTIEVAEEETLPKIEALENMRFAGIKIVAATKGSIAATTAEELAQEGKEVKEAKELYTKNLAVYEDLAKTPAEEERWGEIRSSGGNLLEASEEISLVIARQEELTLESKGFEPAAKKFLKTVGTSLTDERNEFSERKKKIDTATKAGIRNIYLVSGAALALAVLLGFFISRSISNSLKKARDVAVEVARGNMDVAIDTSGKDEVAELSRAIDKMRRSLKVVFEEYEKKIK